MKVIFLDIDGVLNSHAYERVRREEDGNIDESRMLLLKRLVEETGARIVLSSTWRKHWEADPTLCDAIGRELNALFGKYGLTIYDKTPLIPSVDRAEEIRCYLRAHEGEFEAFVILDDTFLGWLELSPYHVKTDFRIKRGLEESHVEKAIAILKA